MAVMTVSFMAPGSDEAAVLPEGTIYVTTWSELLSAVEQELAANGAATVDLIQIDGHGGTPGTLQLGDIDIDRSDDEVLASGPASIASGIQERHEQIAELGDFVTSGGTIQFVQCCSGAGAEGDELMTTLQGLFGDDINIHLWSDNVGWIDYFGLRPYPTSTNGGKKDVSK
jgi:hypothetical protein